MAGEVQGYLYQPVRSAAAGVVASAVFFSSGRLLPGIVSNNKQSEIGRHADVAIEVETGPEALSGSTRLKAGTAQKLVLNLLSTGTMIQQGKTYSNLMVDVKATNEKLQARCLNILREIFPETDTEKLAQALASANGSVKLAAVIIRTGLPVEDARAVLERNDGHLRRVFGEA